jgi:hypothetical protein
MRMDKLEQRGHNQTSFPGLYNEIINYLQPSSVNSRERIVKIAIQKMEGITGADLGTRVTTAAEAALLEVFHKGIDSLMRSYMN